MPVLDVTLKPTPVPENPAAKLIVLFPGSIEYDCPEIGATNLATKVA